MENGDGIIKFPTERMNQEGNGANIQDSGSADSNNVIHVDFAAKAMEREKQERDLFLSTINRAPIIRAFLRSLQGHVSRGSIVAKKDLVEQYDDVQVMKLIVNSSEADWKTRPGFFVALLDRFDRGGSSVQGLSEISAYEEGEGGVMDLLSKLARGMKSKLKE